MSNDGIMADTMDTAPDISTADVIKAALNDFKSALTPTHQESFSGKEIRHVQLKIVKIQHHQERVKGMMNFSRISFYLERFAEFDNLCKSTKVAGADASELSSFIWGPSAFILEVGRHESVACPSEADVPKDIPGGCKHPQYCPRCVSEVWETDPPARTL